MQGRGKTQAADARVEAAFGRRGDSRIAPAGRWPPSRRFSTPSQDIRNDTTRYLWRPVHVGDCRTSPIAGQPPLDSASSRRKHPAFHEAKPGGNGERRLTDPSWRPCTGECCRIWLGVWAHRDAPIPKTSKGDSIYTTVSRVRRQTHVPRILQQLHYGVPAPLRYGVIAPTMWCR